MNLIRYFLVFSIALFAIAAHAESTSHMTMINHFDKPIHFTMMQHRVNVPDFQDTFTLAPQNSISSRVTDTEKDTNAYIAGEANANEKVFFSVSSLNNKTIIRGYLSTKIAYSWKGEIITFCTPDFFNKNGKKC